MIYTCACGRRVDLTIKHLLDVKEIPTIQESFDSSGLSAKQKDWSSVLAAAFASRSRVAGHEIWDLIGQDYKNKESGIAVRVVMEKLGFVRRSIREGRFVSKGWARISSPRIDAVLDEKYTKMGSR